LAAGEIIVYFDKGQDPIANLKREIELFNLVDGRAQPECVRFWLNSRCLVRGPARSAKHGWYNEELARELEIPVIERTTGGGVVYHDEGNLNWSFFQRTSGSFQSPTASFDRVSKFIIGALNRLGIHAKFSPPNRIDVSDRKVSGMAARSTVHTLLVHGTLLLRSDLKTLNRLCIPPPGCPPVSNLSEWKPNVDAESVMKAVIGVLEDSGFKVRMGEGSS
jgi:lipoate---protein ligase